MWVLYDNEELITLLGVKVVMLKKKVLINQLKMIHVEVFNCDLRVV